MILTFIIFLLILTIFIIYFIPEDKNIIIRQITLGVSSLVFIFSIFLMDLFSFNQVSFLYNTFIIQIINLNTSNASLTLSTDGLSVFFVILSTFLIFLCVVFIWDESILFKESMLILLILDLFLILTFTSLDLLIFYIFFESILIPMFIMIGTFGSRERKIRAVYLFFFYTLLGSLCMLLGLLYIFSELSTLNYEYLYFHNFSFNEQLWLWVAFFLSFAAKIPLFPIHIWLPEAHVEAPTIGSVLLAGILLKLGVYGFVRFNLILFPEASLYFAPIVYILSILGIIFASMTALRQTDLKRIIAYSSVAHMNLVTIGIFSFNSLGVEGAILQSLSHGFVSGAMFFLIGILYKRYHSRFIYYYSGLTHMMPLYSSFFMAFTMANIALPGTSSFVGEFLLLVGIFKTSILIAMLSALGVILCGSYSLWLYNRLCFGNLNINSILYFKDLDRKEFFILSTLLILIILMGVYPKIFLTQIGLKCLIKFN
jgi:NADH-quinone oxidoreductase subunit M